MLLGRVIGTLTPCVVYKGLEGVPMLWVQPLDKQGKPKGEPLVACDSTRAAELALKGTNVRLIELRLAEYEMSGKAISLFNGELYDVQAAMELAGDFLRGRKEYVQHRIICRPHEALTKHLADGTGFATSKPLELEGEEVS